MAFNYRLDAGVTALFLTMVALIFLFSLREWVLLLARRKLAAPRETAPVWLPEYAVAEGRPLRLWNLLALALLLIKELSGEAAMERARQAKPACDCQEYVCGSVPAQDERKVYCTLWKSGSTASIVAAEYI